MKKIALALLVVLAIASVSEAGFIFRRKASGRATPVRNAAGKVFGGCANGQCGR